MRSLPADLFVEAAALYAGAPLVQARSTKSPPTIKSWLYCGYFHLITRLHWAPFGMATKPTLHAWRLVPEDVRVARFRTHREAFLAWQQGKASQDDLAGLLVRVAGLGDLVCDTRVVYECALPSSRLDLHTAEIWRNLCSDPALLCGDAAPARWMSLEGHPVALPPTDATPLLVFMDRTGRLRTMAVAHDCELALADELATGPPLRGQIDMFEAA